MVYGFYTGKSTEGGVNIFRIRSSWWQFDVRPSPHALSRLGIFSHFLAFETELMRKDATAVHKLLHAPSHKLSLSQTHVAQNRKSK